MRGIAGFVLIVVFAALAPLLCVRAAEPTKMFHVGAVLLGDPRPGPNLFAFEQKLRELGYVEGKTLAFDYLGLERIETYPQAMEELVRRKVDVIITGGPEFDLKAAKRATSTIPVVMLAVDFDPEARGYVASLARPGGNITGVYQSQIELTAKRVDLLKQGVPDITRAIVFWDASSADQIDVATTTAQALNLPIKSVELRDPPYDYAGALAAVDLRPGDALLFLTSPFFNRDRNRLAELAVRHRLPSMFGNRQYADAGGLFSYGPNYPVIRRLQAEYVDKILRGTAPADLPVQQPTRFELVINLETAKALGLTISHTVLLLADEVIE
jgi:putative ABC transport system substrate-binding protein